MRLEGFVGPSNSGISYKYDFERTINFYTEYSGAGVPKSKGALIGTPGLRVRWNLPGGLVRCLFAQDGHLYAVVGNVFYELYQNYTYVVRGSVADSPYPATICSNGSDGGQLFITSGGYGYIFNGITNVFTQITDPSFPTNAWMGAFLDGYFVVLQIGTDKFFISALEDGLSWNGVDVGQSNQSSDQSTALIVDHREIWLFGTTTSSVWYNNGDSGFPFVPINGVFLQIGIYAPWTAKVLNGAVYWLGHTSDQGGVAVYKAQQYTPVRVSTHAIEWKIMQQFQGGPVNPGTTLAWTYFDDGHWFYCLYFPELDTTLVYDATASEATGQHTWHERAHWNPQLGTWQPHVAVHHAFFSGKHFVGDRRCGAIYEQSLFFFDEELAVP